MKDKNIDKLKELIEHKKDHNNSKKKIIPDRKIGSGHGANSNMKSTGSNNKV
ncbi:MAG: hypothetical protein PF505_05955 [Vallitaleaceae bacterium]|jgi:hypothetical protein|nr:hypothetical protein [Vallitaleaceae bacterium]